MLPLPQNERVRFLFGCEAEMDRYNTIADEDMEILLRPYRIAKEEGCLFYLGSDAHSLEKCDWMKEKFQKITDLLKLDDSHKFTVT